MAISKSEMGTLPKIVAIDFDGTLVADKYPSIGEPNLDMFQLCARLKEAGVKLILWTCRDGDFLKDAVDYICNGIAPQKRETVLSEEETVRDHADISSREFTNIDFEDLDKK